MLLLTLLLPYVYSVRLETHELPKCRDVYDHPETKCDTDGAVFAKYLHDKDLYHPQVQITTDFNTKFKDSCQPMLQSLKSEMKKRTGHEPPWSTGGDKYYIGSLGDYAVELISFIIYSEFQRVKDHRSTSEYHICQIGFNWGYSTVGILCPFTTLKGENIYLHNFDIGGTPYFEKAVEATENFVLKDYKHIKFDMTEGSSIDTVPLSKYKCDIAFIDGNHGGEYPYKDLVNIRELAKRSSLFPDVMVIMDDVLNIHTNVGQCMIRAIEEGIAVYSPTYAFKARRTFLTPFKYT